MYDIYLSSSCRQLPELSALTPMLSKPTLLSALLQQKLGFLGLNLSGDTATSLLEQVVLAEGYGYVVPVAYRQPKVTALEAMPIAKQVIAQRQEAYFPTYAFEPVQFSGEDAMWWKFAAASQELGQSGHIPGTVSVLVDKLDGHLWTEQEEVNLYAHGEEYYLESATTLTPQQILDLLASSFGLAWGTDYRYENESCLLGPALMVAAVKHSFPAVIEKEHGFWPTVQLRFRIIPYKTGYESAPLLLLRAVTKVLCYDSRDAVLVFDEGELATLLEQVSGQLVLGEAWSRWAEKRSVSQNAVKMRQVSMPQLSIWTGKQRIGQPKVRSRRMEAKADLLLKTT